MTINLLPAQWDVARKVVDNLERFLTPGHRRTSTTDAERQESDRIKQRVGALIQTSEVSYNGFITIQYFSFPQWLAVYFDSNQWVLHINQRDPRVEDVEASIRNWLFDRMAYLGTRKQGGSVADQLDAIAASSTGSAVLRAVKDGAAGHKVCIVPDNMPMDGGNTQTLPSDSVHGFKDGKDPGQGVDVSVVYSPELWAGGSPGRGLEADSQLIHELVHTSRDLHGVADFSRVNIYKNVDEFIAVVITNIYISETRPLAPLRGSYGDVQHAPIRLLKPDRFLDNWQHVHPSPRQLLNNFSVDQQELYNDLAFLAGIAFNPIAQLDWEKNPDKRWNVVRSIHLVGW